jgi:tRNA threonylcarbamoyl adenosine modification protein YjeE
MVYITSSPDETIAVGREIAASISAPRLILLEGDLGAGKTTLAKGIVSGLGAAGEDDVSSPTFALVQEYGPGPQVYHIDLYRLDNAPDLDSLGLEDIWNSGAVVLMEWGGRFKTRFPGQPVEIRLQYLDGDQRKIEVAGLPAEAAQ